MDAAFGNALHSGPRETYESEDYRGWRIHYDKPTAVFYASRGAVSRGIGAKRDYAKRWIDLQISKETAP